MADRGITFSAAMVRALLEGRKTQTRRLLSPQPVWEPEVVDGFTFAAGWAVEKLGLSSWRDSDEFREHLRPLVRHQPGDRLYVREHWKVDACYDAVAPRDLLTLGTDEPLSGWDHALCYLATAPAESLRDPVWGRHRQAMHMPRWASRLTLLVTDVRVQRLGDMSEADAMAEGIYAVGGRNGWTFDAENWFASPKIAFHRLWDSLHTDPGTRWEDNPFIYAASFDVRRGNIDEKIGGGA